LARACFRAVTDRAGRPPASRRPTNAVEILVTTSMVSPAAKLASQGMLSDAFAPMFQVDLMGKDLTLALELAGGPVTKAASNVVGEARARGLSGENLTAVAKLYP
jgi:3-hydroxyisobutyrate dehydrogenase-like beta-hydroxyacid dehydrogenase